MTERKQRPLPQTVNEAFYELVHHSPVSPKAMAEACGVAYSTFVNAANGGDGAPRTDIVWLNTATQMTRNFVTLDFLERACGRVAVTVDAKLPDGATIQDEVMRVAKELGDACEAIRKALDPKGARGAAISGDEKTRIKKETYELLKEAARLWKLAEGL